MKEEKHFGKFYLGTYTPVPGRLVLNHDSSHLIIWDCGNKNVPPWTTIVHGLTSHGQNVTLLNCSTPQNMLGVEHVQEDYFEAKVDFKFAILGEEKFIEQNEEVIAARFCFEGLTNFFGVSANDCTELSDEGYSVVSRSFNTAYGDISILSRAKRSRSWFRIEEEALVEVEFTREEFADNVWKIVRDLHYLFGLFIRNLPKLLYVRIFKESDDEYTRIYSVEERKGDDSIKDGPPVDDFLASPEFCPNNFAEVIKEWISKIQDTERNTAVLMFFDCFFSSKFTPERHIKICSAFDHLPKSDRKYKNGKSISNLKDIVQNRFETIRKGLEHYCEFEEMEIAIEFAVKCRNFYVHSQNRMYSQIFMEVEFRQHLTSTLEFIFGMSLLLECGWNPQDWFKRFQSSFTQRHPFSSYLVRCYSSTCSLINRRQIIERDSDVASDKKSTHN